MAIRCGQDSDCNPGSVGAVLGTIVGFDKLPGKWKSNIAFFSWIPFLYSGYSFNRLVRTSFDRACKAVAQEGGVVMDSQLKIPEQVPRPPRMLEEFGTKSIKR